MYMGFVFVLMDLRVFSLARFKIKGEKWRTLVLSYPYQNYKIVFSFFRFVVYS